MSKVYRPVSAAVGESLVVQAIRAEHPDAASLRTGLRCLDTRTAEAWDAGQVVVIAAGSGQGKSALSAQLATEFAAQDSVLHFILEDEDRDVVNRQMAALARADVTRIRRGDLVGDADLAEAAAHLSSLDYHTVDRMRLTMEQIGVIAAEWKRAEGVARGVVVIDQLSHVIDTDAKTDSHRMAARAPRVGDERAQIEWKMNVAKAIAESVGVLMIVLVQHNENHGDSRPGLSSLRGSRGIGHYATLVVHIHRPKQIESLFALPGEPMDAPEDHAEIVVSKSRVGPGDWHEEVRWVGHQQRFCDADEAEDSPYRAPDAPTEAQKAGARKLAELRSRFEGQRQTRQMVALANLEQPAIRTVDDDEMPPPPDDHDLYDVA